MIYRFEPFELDTQQYQLLNEGSPVPVEPKVFDLLRHLVQNRHRMVNREELFNSIWKDRVVSDTSLSNHIRAARKAIGDNGKSQSSIKTIHGRGYQFVADTTEAINHGSDLSKLKPSGGVNWNPCLVVLPFQNISADDSQKFFAEGMSEDITTELSRFSDIRVIARHSAFQFDSPSADIGAIQKKLGVDYLVEGSVRKQRDSIRINVQLIDCHTLDHVWAEKYDGPLSQVFKLQDEIIETVVSTICGQVRRIETERSVRRGTKNLNAYDHLLRGLQFHKNGYAGYDDNKRAYAEFSKAIELDPDFARARAWIVCSGAALWEEKTTQRIHKAIDDAKYALSLDPRESETHRILGSLYLYDRQFELSGIHWDQAKMLSPNDAHIAVKMSRYYAYTDRLKESLETAKRAMRLNPGHPGWYWSEMGITYYSMDRYDRAITAFNRNWETSAFDLAMIAATHVAAGDADSANTFARKALDHEPRSTASLFTQYETYQDQAKHRLLYERMVAAGIPG